jgi:hypothetical protein
MASGDLTRLLDATAAANGSFFNALAEPTAIARCGCIPRLDAWALKPTSLPRLEPRVFSGAEDPDDRFEIELVPQSAKRQRDGHLQ